MNGEYGKLQNQPLGWIPAKEEHINILSLTLDCQGASMRLHIFLYITLNVTMFNYTLGTFLLPTFFFWGTSTAEITVFKVRLKMFGNV